MKMQMDSAHIHTPTNSVWNHSPNSGPMSISISRASRPVTMELMSSCASESATPAALFTTLCAASNTPMTMFHVLVTMRTAQAVLKIQRKKSHVSTSFMLFLSTMS